MSFMGPCPMPPAPVQCSVHESEHSLLSNGRLSDSSRFANLLCDLFSEHQRCVREAAKDGQQASETQVHKASAYIPSPGSLYVETLRMNACDQSTEKQKLIETLQAHVQLTESPPQEAWQITHPKEVGLKPTCLAAPAEPEQDQFISNPADMSWQPVCSKGVEQHQVPKYTQRQETFMVGEAADKCIGHDASMDKALNSSQSSFATKPQSCDGASRETHRMSPGPPRGGTVSIISQPQGTFARGLSSVSATSLKSHCAVEFFEQHKESCSDERPNSKSKASIASTYSISTWDMLPGSLAARTMSRVLQSLWFELLAGGLILANTCILAVELQYAAKEPTFENQVHEDWLPAASVFVILERVFTVIFTLELIFRLSVLGRVWFRGWLNWIDFVFVMVSWFDWLYTEAGVVNPTMARMVRLVRIGRGLRLTKLSRVLGSLHLLVRSIIASVSILSWSVCILLIAQCIWGMMLCQLVQPFIMDVDKDLIARQQVFAYYGTFSRSMITMFEIHLANFGPACRVLLDYVGEEYAYLFLAYRCFAGFAIINIINAVFVQQTMKVAEADQDVMLNQKRKAVETYTRKVRAFFNVLDSDGDGTISHEELSAFEDNPTYQLWMSSLDIEASDLRGVFGILDTDNDGAITADELILGASRIKGPARSIDMVHVLAHLQALHYKVDGLFRTRTSTSSVARHSSRMSDGSRVPIRTLQSNASEHSRVRTL